eukprot:GHRR01007715.1.p1 GENE.GHRR01007715.1~~GHRR01007715.1.p1  ORF type:complete len:562 (+),score=206.10 GHRR01007715.1:237-1922(+)
MQTQLAADSSSGGLTKSRGRWCKMQARVCSSSLVQAILIAQLLSLAIASTGVGSQALTQQGVYAPTFQAFLNYCLLALVFGLRQLFACRSQQADSLQQGSSSLQHDAEACLAAEAHCSGNIHPQQHIYHQTDSEAANWSQQQRSKSGGDGGISGLSNSSIRQWQRPWFGRCISSRLRRALPALAALALIDVEANMLVTKAYQYTSLTSITLLDCFTIPSVMLLSWLVLGSRYKAGHFAGAGWCVAGLVVLVLGDSNNSAAAGAAGIAASSSASRPTGSLIATSVVPWNSTLAIVSAPAISVLDAGRHLLSTLDSQTLSSINGTVSHAVSNVGSTGLQGSVSGSSSLSGSAPLFGDALVLLGAVLYGVCNVTQELLLGDLKPAELLAFLGLCGAIISGAQALLFEHTVLFSVHWLQLSVAGPMLGFAVAMFCFYSMVPWVLVLGGATVLNLNLLTSDVWAALARFVLFGGFQGATGYYFAASLVLVAAGIVMYALSGSPNDPPVATAGAGTTTTASPVTVEAHSNGSQVRRLIGLLRGLGFRGTRTAGSVEYSRVATTVDRA